MKLKHIYTCLIFLSILSCQTKNDALESALKLAGNNRSELEKVLNHYSQNPADSLKLKAAEFLIENMPGHYTLEGALINEYREKIDNASISYLNRKQLDISLGLLETFKNDSHKIQDVETITAEFLIRHIDLSFVALNTYPWLENLPFDIFLDYILPYRFENERLDLWRDSLHVNPDYLHNILAHKELSMHTISGTNKIIKLAESQAPAPLALLEHLLGRDIYKECNHLSQRDNFSARATNFPLAIDYIPYYANRNGFHQWTTTISPEFKETNMLQPYSRKAAKVFRKTYSRNNILTPKKNEYVPELFQDPFFKDVTALYLYTTDVVISVNKKIMKSPRYAYLCVFNSLEWQPTAIGVLERNKAKFKDIGRNIIYLPVAHVGKKMLPLNFPFILDQKGEVKHLIPDTCNRQTLRLNRKYPFALAIHHYNKQFEELVITASNHPLLSIRDTLSKSLSSTKTYHDLPLASKYAYRYWCFTNSFRNTEFAEIVFLNAKGEPIRGETDSLYMNAFDGRSLSFCTLPQNQELIVDFGQSVEISRITFIPRSDGNGVYMGEEYELFYHDSNGWQSLGRQIAKDYFLEYNNVPQGALLWLHNHTTGIEERIFTHENGNIRFW